MKHDLTADELLDVNTQCRRYVGKPVDQCDHDDLMRVRAGLAVDIAFLKIVRTEKCLDVERIHERARRRGRGVGITDDPTPGH
ncbi:hypothetical protein IGS73_07225 [Janibacter indicus]|uniref:Uncharacterized protein n=1 Tax=Janibacter indicus TaxID=857417 RepID=A0A7L9J4L9_9MICO|nr:hypothetical protein [Janibacter indicus]QOK24147.1 hypothetical protein IGS73_07225 [Janibacter indicus]